MSREEIELTAYCGLYCGDCIRFRSRVSDLAGELATELQATEFDKYADIKSSAVKQMNAVKNFDHYREFYEVLEAIAALQCNTPCRTSGGCPTFSCQILECCKKKEYEGCWQCNAFKYCDKLELIF